MSRLIKKYPNRRLYDTESSTYITLNDIKNLIISSEDFVIVDVKKGDDITRSVLLQILMEEENSNNPIFSMEFLKLMIRCYGHPMQNVFYSYFEKSVKDFFSSYANNNNNPDDDLCGSSQWPGFMGVPSFQEMMNNYFKQTNAVFGQMKDQVEKMWRVSPSSEDKAEDS